MPGGMDEIHAVAVAIPNGAQKEKEKKANDGGQKKDQEDIILGSGQVTFHVHVPYPCPASGTLRSHT